MCCILAGEDVGRLGNKLVGALQPATKRSQVREGWRRVKRHRHPFAIAGPSIRANRTANGREPSQFRFKPRLVG
jgi:hypothetical protein